MAKATNKTYESLASLYVDRDMEVRAGDRFLLKSLQIDFDKFKNYVEACKKANKRRKESWMKLFDDTGMGYQNYKEEM
tara:strand:+ start:524 stop:757 length:234 start_codon:yes stop_codon:yes gene_type:complete